MIELSYEMLNGKKYNGTSKPFGATIGGIDYIVKPNRAGTYSATCECMAQDLYKELGINTAEVELAEYRCTKMALVKEIELGEENFISKGDAKVYMCEDVISNIEALCTERSLEFNKEEIKEELYRIAIADFLYMNFNRKTSSLMLTAEDGRVHIGRVIDNEGIYNCGYINQDYIELRDNGGIEYGAYLLSRTVHQWMRILDTRGCSHIGDISERILRNNISRREANKILEIGIDDIAYNILNSTEKAGCKEELAEMMLVTTISRLMTLQGMDVNDTVWKVKDEIKRFI